MTTKVANYWHLVHELTAVVLTRALILGPLERMKIILQAKHMAKYANPIADTPRGIADLSGSK